MRRPALSGAALEIRDGRYFHASLVSESALCGSPLPGSHRTQIPPVCSALPRWITHQSLLLAVKPDDTYRFHHYAVFGPWVSSEACKFPKAEKTQQSPLTANATAAAQPTGGTYGQTQGGPCCPLLDRAVAGLLARFPASPSMLDYLITPRYSRAPAPQPKPVETVTQAKLKGSHTAETSLCYCRKCFKCLCVF